MKMTAKRTKEGGKKVIVNAAGLQIKLKERRSGFMKQRTVREVMAGIVVFSMIILVKSSLLTGKIKKMKTLTKRTVRKVVGAITVNVNDLQIKLKNTQEDKNHEKVCKS